MGVKDVFGPSDHVWDESGANAYRPSGKVGIGTASPRTTLHVATSDSDDQNVLRLEEAFGSDPCQFVFELADTGISGLAAKNMNIQGLSSTSDMAFSPSSDTQGALILKDGGGVGIGGAPLTDEKFAVDLSASEFIITKYAGSSGFKHSSTGGNTILENKRLYTSHIQLTTPAGGGAYVVGQGSGLNCWLGVNTDAPTGALAIVSTTGALVLPRMTTTQRNAISGAAGMIVFNTSTNKAQVHDGAGWNDLH